MTLVQPRRVVLALSLLLVGAGAPAALAQAPQIEVKLTAWHVVAKDDKESLVPADKAKPGDVLEYEAVYKNSGTGAARNIAATVPIPAGLALLENTARPASQQGSTDGKNFEALPLKRKVRNAAGASQEQPVPLKDYRALRWMIPDLQPGASATVALRARVVSNGPN